MFYPPLGYRRHPFVQSREQNIFFMPFRMFKHGRRCVNSATEGYGMTILLTPNQINSIMKQQLLSFIAFVTCMQVYSQNVGIGIDNPIRAKLEVNGAAGATSAIFGGEGAGISLQRSWPSVGFNQYYTGGTSGSKYMSDGFAGVQYLDPNTGNFSMDLFEQGDRDWPTHGARRIFSFLPSGVGLIGPNYFNANLAVSRGNDQIATACFFGYAYNSLFNYDLNQDTYIRAGKANSKVVINDIPGGKIIMSGKIGINTGTPGTPLEIYQDGEGSDHGISLVNPYNSYNSWQQWIHGGTLFLGYRYSAMGFFSQTDGSYNNFSDVRLKRNVHALSGILKKVMALEPVEYEMIKFNPDHSKSLGFIAQDVKKLFPELVTVTKDKISGYEDLTEVHSLNYNGFGVLAIKAIQEQQVLIDQLKETLSKQQQMNENLVKRIESLEKINLTYLNNQTK